MKAKVQKSRWSVEEELILRSALFDGTKLTDIKNRLPRRTTEAIRRRASSFGFRSKSIDDVVRLYKGVKRKRTTSGGKT